VPHRSLALAAAVLVLGACSATEPDPAAMGCHAIGCVDGTPTADPVGTCTESDPDSTGGRYAVGHAGWVTVYRQGDTLTLDRIQPAEGWRHEIVAETGTGIDLRFTHLDEIVDFGAEVEDGLVYAEHCTVA
jgi:hypothetical protein